MMAHCPNFLEFKTSVTWATKSSTTRCFLQLRALTCSALEVHLSAVVVTCNSLSCTHLVRLEAAIVTSKIVSAPSVRASFQMMLETALCMDTKDTAMVRVPTASTATTTTMLTCKHHLTQWPFSRTPLATDLKLLASRRRQLCRNGWSHSMWDTQ